MDADPDAAPRATLRRHRVFASALLVLMAVLATVGYALALTPWTGLLRDAGRAGFIGGLADWFAVTALFRRPLGLPIPHTAILPAQKARLGEALGRFVANYVVTEADIGLALDRIDTPAMLARFFADPAAARPIAMALANMVPKVLASLEDGRARRVIGRLLPRLLGGRAAGAVLARALFGLVEGGRHQEVLSFILNELKRILAAREEVLRETIKERVREQGGRLVGWAVGATIARRIMSAVNTELERVGPDSSELRDAFDEWARREIGRLESDPARAAELGQAVSAVLAHDSVLAWAADVWSRLRRAVEADAARPGGRTVALIEDALVGAGGALAADPAARRRVEAALRTLVLSALPAARLELASFIGRAVGAWDTATLTDRLELRVGKDLQYIRMNGTIVGFLAGAAIYGLLLLVPHR